MKRFVLFITAVTLLIGSGMPAVFAGNTISNDSVQKKVLLYLKPDITVELNGVRKIFKDVKGEAVYPVIYNGSTYLPVRAASSLMKEPIEWDSGSKTVFIGKTISYPNKKGAPIPTGAAITANEAEEDLYRLPPSLVTGYLKPDVLVMYDFTIQSFHDANGNSVYPIIYNGSVYLPVRAISYLMDEPIIWDGAAKKISIGDGTVEEEEPVVAEPEEEGASEAFLLLKSLYEKEEILYYEATAKITNLSTATADEKQMIAASASENYQSAQALTAEAKAMDQTSFTREEKAIYEKLVSFAESNEYYILVLENIAYLAASDSDYSMLAETFLYFAMDAKTKMEEAEALFTENY